MRRTDADGIDDLFELILQMIGSDKHQFMIGVLILNFSYPGNQNAVLLQVRIEPPARNIIFLYRIETQDPQPFGKFSQGSVCSEAKIHC